MGQSRILKYRTGHDTTTYVNLFIYKSKSIYLLSTEILIWNSDGLNEELVPVIVEVAIL